MDQKYKQYFDEGKYIVTCFGFSIQNTRLTMILFGEYVNHQKQLVEIGVPLGLSGAVVFTGMNIFNAINKIKSLDKILREDRDKYISN